MCFENFQNWSGEQLRSPASVPERLRDFYVVSCEHGGNRIPAAYVDLFHGWQAFLSSHRGYDPGALIMARDLAVALQAPLVASTVSRLLVDLNRSLSNPRVVGCDPGAIADEQAGDRIAPLRAIPGAADGDCGGSGRGWEEGGPCFSHSFTPILDGQVRNADIGLLYDPARLGEVAVAARWKAALAEQSGELRVRRNYPYQGRTMDWPPRCAAASRPASMSGLRLNLIRRWCALSRVCGGTCAAPS